MYSLEDLKVKILGPPPFPKYNPAINVTPLEKLVFETYKPTRVTDPVWENFVRYKYDLDKNIAVCKKCRDQARLIAFQDLSSITTSFWEINMSKNSNTTHLKKHVEYKHNSLVVEQKKRKISEIMTTSPKHLETVKEKWIKFLVFRHLPLSLGTELETQELLGSISAPQELVNFAKDINDVRGFITAKTAELQLSLEKHLKYQNFAITSDHWTSCATEAFFAITAHFIDDDWNLRSICLGCEPHTAKATGTNIHLSIVQKIEQFGLNIDQLVCTVSDTASNMVVAGSNFRAPHHYCVAHVLELTSKLAFDDTYLVEGDGVISCSKKIVHHFNSSTTSSNLLVQAQIGHRKVLKLTTDTKTRWWSTFSMIKRLLRMRNILDDLAALYRTPTLTEVQWIYLKEMRILLETFHRAQKNLEGEKYVTVSLISSIIYKVRWDVSVFLNGDYTEPVKNLAAFMINDFNERWGAGRTRIFGENENHRFRSIGLSSYVVIAAALDPRRKSLLDVTEAERIFV